MIQFSREAYDAVLDHAIEGGDREVCGVLAGTYDPERSTVEAVYRTENVAETPETRYRIDPEDQFEILERIENEDREVIGFYHSHPSDPPNPSATDAAQATWTDYSYVIVALDGRPFLGSWRWRGKGGNGAFEQELVRIDPG